MVGQDLLFLNQKVKLVNMVQLTPTGRRMLLHCSANKKQANKMTIIYYTRPVLWLKIILQYGLMQNSKTDLIK